MKLSALFALAVLALSSAAFAHQKPTLGAKPPRGAIVLFNGSDTSAWVQRGTTDPIKWQVADGDLVNVPGSGDIMTKQNFGDYRLHVEFWLPLLPTKTSQERANSGVYQQGRWEIQVLDSYNNPTYAKGGCGSIYSFKDPDKNAIIPPEQWNSYDITFHAAKFDSTGKQTENPRITVIHNGITIHNNVELTIPNTGGAMDNLPPGLGPVDLQDHGAAVKFRNVWIVPLSPKRA